MNEEGLPEKVEETRLLLPHRHPTIATAAAASGATAAAGSGSRIFAITESSGGNNEDEFAFVVPVRNNNNDDDHHSWIRVALIFVAGALSLPSLVAGMKVFGGALDASSAPYYYSSSPSLFATPITAVGCGNVLLAIFASLTGTIGIRTGRHTYGLACMALGPRGAAFLNAAFGVSLLGWFGVNLNIFSQAVVEMNRIGSGGILLNHKIAVELMGAMCMTLTTRYGIQGLERLSLFLAPVLAIVTACLIYKGLAMVASHADGTAITTEQNKRLVDKWLSRSRRLNDGTVSNKQHVVPTSFGQLLSSVVGVSIIGAIIVPDYTRFIREPWGAVYCAILGFAVTLSLVEWAGGVATVAFRSDDLLDIFTGMGWNQWEAVAAIIAGTWILNAMNLYSASLSFAAATAAFGLEIPACVGILGVLGFSVALVDVLDSFMSYLYYLSVVFVPVAGVIAVDYVFLRRSVYEARDETLSGRPPYRPAALLGWAFGAGTAVLSSTGVLIITRIAVLDALIVSAGSYYFMSLLSFDMLLLRL